MSLKTTIFLSTAVASFLITEEADAALSTKKSPPQTQSQESAQQGKQNEKSTYIYPSIKELVNIFNSSSSPKDALEKLCKEGKGVFQKKEGRDCSATPHSAVVAMNICSKFKNFENTPCGKNAIGVTWPKQKLPLDKKTTLEDLMKKQIEPIVTKEINKDQYTSEIQQDNQNKKGILPWFRSNDKKKKRTPFQELEYYANDGLEATEYGWDNAKYLICKSKRSNLPENLNKALSEKKCKSIQGVPKMMPPAAPAVDSDSKSKDNLKSKPKDNSKSKSKDNSKSDSKDNSKSKSKDNSKSDSKDNSKSDSKDNSKSKSKDNSKSKSKDNSKSQPQDNPTIINPKVKPGAPDPKPQDNPTIITPKVKPGAPDPKPQDNPTIINPKVKPGAPDPKPQDNPTIINPKVKPGAPDPKPQDNPTIITPKVKPGVPEPKPQDNPTIIIPKVKPGAPDPKPQDNPTIINPKVKPGAPDPKPQDNPTIINPKVKPGAPEPKPQDNPTIINPKVKPGAPEPKPQDNPTIINPKVKPGAPEPKPQDNPTIINPKVKPDAPEPKPQDNPTIITPKVKPGAPEPKPQDNPTIITPKLTPPQKQLSSVGKVGPSGNKMLQVNPSLISPDSTQGSALGKVNIKEDISPNNNPPIITPPITPALRNLKDRDGLDIDTQSFSSTVGSIPQQQLSSAGKQGPVGNKMLQNNPTLIRPDSTQGSVLGRVNIKENMSSGEQEGELSINKNPNQQLRPAGKQGPAGNKMLQNDPTLIRPDSTQGAALGRVTIKENMSSGEQEGVLSINKNPKQQLRPAGKQGPAGNKMLQNDPTLIRPDSTQGAALGRVTIKENMSSGEQEGVLSINKNPNQQLRSAGKQGPSENRMLQNNPTLIRPDSTQGAALGRVTIKENMSSGEQEGVLSINKNPTPQLRSAGKQGPSENRMLQNNPSLISTDSTRGASLGRVKIEESMSSDEQAGELSINKTPNPQLRPAGKQVPVGNKMLQNNPSLISTDSTRGAALGRVNISKNSSQSQNSSEEIEGELSINNNPKQPWPRK